MSFPTNKQSAKKAANAALVEARRQEVIDMIAELHTTHHIMVTLAKKWGVDANVVMQHYIKPVRLRMREQYADGQPYAADRLRETLTNLYQEARKTGDLRTAAQCLKQMAQIDGANAPVNWNGTVATTNEVAIGVGNPEATRERMAALLARPDIQARLAAQGLTIKKA